MTIKINNKCHFSERKKENTHKRKKRKRKKVKMCSALKGDYMYPMFCFKILKFKIKNNFGPIYSHFKTLDPHVLHII